MFELGRRFSLTSDINKSLSLLSKIQTLHDIRILGHVMYPEYIKTFERSPTGFEISFTNHHEIQLYEHGKIAKEDLWKYYINEYNFRDTWDFSETDSKKIGCFGDSFTFGDGLRSEETHVNYLRELTNARVYNVGRGGASVERVVRIFAAFTKFVNIDVAVFTFPHVHREFFVDPRGAITDLIPNAPSSNYHYKYMQPFFNLHDNYQMVKMSRNINHIMDIADARNIKVLFTTWDYPTQDMLKIISPENTAKEIFPNNLDVNCARDLKHPGKRSQEKHAQNILRELNDRTWI